MNEPYRGANFNPGKAEGPIYMACEWTRLASFVTWPKWARVRPTELAAGGFYYTGPTDHVTCFSCGVELGEWQPGQRPQDEHRRHSPDCGIIRGSDKTNVAMVTVPDPRPLEADDEGRLAVTPTAYSASGATAGEVASKLSGSVALAKSLGQIYDIVPDLSDVERQLDDDVNLRNKSFSEKLDFLCAGDSSFVDGSATSGRLIPRDDGRTFSSSSGSITGTSSNEVYTDVDMTMVNRESYRLSTYRGWPDDAYVGPPELAKNGFFYMGNLDRVKCAFCAGVLRNWRPEDDVRDEHRRHFRFCSFVRGMDVNNVTLEAGNISVQARGNNDLDRDTQIMGVVTESPKHAQYTVEATRVATFSTWPKTGVMAPSFLAQAGFFYTGYGDNCLCFFCDGGIKNWQASDDPWSEHARWFPQCGFLKIAKGDTYIRAIQTRYGANASEVTAPRAAVTSPPSQDTGMLSSGAKYGMVDSHSVQAQMDTPAARAVLQMNFPKQLVKRLITQRLRREGSGFPDTPSLLQAVFDARDEGEAGAEEEVEEEEECVGDGGRPEDPGETARAQGVTQLVANQPHGTDESMTKSKRKRLRQKAKRLATADQGEAQTGSVDSRRTPETVTRGHTAVHDPAAMVPDPAAVGPYPAAVAAADDAGQAGEEAGSQGGASGEDEEPPERERELLVAENERMKEQRLCKVCMDEQVAVAFLPCGHLVCCGTCATALRVCPVCRQRVRGVVRVCLS